VRRILRENMLIEVYDQENDIYYKSIIQELNPDAIAIGIPMKEQKQLLLYEGTTWTLRLLMDNAIYFFQSRVIGRKYSGNVPLYLISWPEGEQIERKQRREYFRLRTVLDLEYWVLQEESFSSSSDKEPEENPAETDEVLGQIDWKMPLEKLVKFLGEPEKGLVADLSGGGLLMILFREIPVGSLLGIRLFLGKKGKERAVLVKGKVVRVAAADKKAIRFRHGVQFVDISSRVREEIIQYVFTRSREKMR